MRKYYKYSDDGFYYSTDEYLNDYRDDKEKYLEQLNFIKKELRNVPLFKDVNSQNLKELLDNTMECLEYFTSGDDQELVIYYDDNYIALTYKGLPEYYELQIENLTIISRDFKVIYFIGSDEEVTDDDYYTYSNVTIFKKDDIGYMRRDYRVPEIPADIPEIILDTDNYDIDKYLLEYHLNSDDIKR